MRKELNLKGLRFGRLTVLSKEILQDKKYKMWKCRCDCGNIIFTRTGHLTTGHIQSCGCLRRDNFNQIITKHGKANERIAAIWYGMRKRCYNKNAKAFKYYGGRGIVICEEWKNDFKIFYDWAMSNGYSDDLTIDRIDVNGNYCPENCRWIRNEEQANNRRNNHLLTYNGETHNMKEWAKIIGINYSTLRGRINNYKWSIEKALTTI